MKCLLWTPLAAAASASLLQAFNHPSNDWSEHTRISAPGSSDFYNATVRWNSYAGPSYAVALTPGTAADVVKAVKIARAQNASLLATGGRHSSTITLDGVDNGVAIDLQRLKSFEIDAENGLLTVSGGVQFGEIIDAVYEAGFEMPVGSCACPGMIGASIGGGVGRFQGINGLLIDSIVSFELVTADGELVKASASENDDLYWAVRGAGQNFGIITSAVYSMPKQVHGGQIFTADFLFSPEQNASYYDLIQDLENKIPAELSTVSVVLWNETIQAAQLLVNWAYIGPEDEARKLVEPLMKLGPISTTQQMVAYNKIYPTILGGLGALFCGNGVVHQVGYGINIAKLSSFTYQTIFQKLSNFYARYPGARGSSLELEVFGNQAVKQIAVDATPYPWRDSLGYVLIVFSWDSEATREAGEALAEEIRADFAATSGYDGLRVYVSYGHGNEEPEQIWGANYPRLQQIKAKWDPDNVFRFFHAITPASSPPPQLYSGMKTEL